MSRQHVAKLCHSFQSGRQDVESRNMTESVRPSSSMTEITTDRIGEMIPSARCVTVGNLVRLRYGSVKHIVSDVLRYSKNSAVKSFAET
ncbi:hypothetical protein TNCV_2545131 [Trichonephila clavipes]|nr:hypothetical protein TNCV_2545131 [Trichonephila clavipes]